jgi:hypothetical protein
MRAIILAASILTASIVLVSILSILLHGAVVRARSRRHVKLIEPAQARLLESLEDPFDPAVGAREMCLLSAREAESILLSVSPAIEGESRTRLRLVAEEAGVVLHALRQVRSRRWSKRLEGARILSVLGVDSPQMEKLLDDPVAVVRAQACEWGATNPRPRVIDKLIRALNDPIPAVEFGAHDSLVRIGYQVVPALTTFLAQALPNLIGPALEVAIVLPDPQLRLAALSACNNPDPSIRARGIRLLRSLGSSDSIWAVTGGLRDPSEHVRSVAVSAYAALAPKQALYTIASMMKDPAYAVRREAGLALRRIGPAGTFVLRRVAADSTDRYAAQMATHALDLQDELIAR